MPKFEFQDQNNVIQPAAHRNKAPRTFADRLVATGLVKNAGQANLLLIGVIVVGFIFIIYINMQTFSGPTVDPSLDFADPMLVE